MGSRTELAVATVSAAWAGVFLAGEGPAVVFAPALGVAALPYRRWPIAAALAVAVVTGAIAAAGVSGENPATLAAGLTVTYALGRYTGGAVAFLIFVLSATWTCGHLVRRRSEGAERAAAVAAELSARDPAALAARAVAEERARLAGDALAIIREAVEAMHREAVTAERDLDPRPLDAIQRRGRAAVAELRRLLGLLRSEVEPAPFEHAVPEAEVGHVGGGQGWRAKAVIAGSLVTLSAIDVAAWSSGAAPGAIALTLAFAAAAALAPFHATAACLLATSPWLLATGLDVPPASGFSSALAAGVLAWSAGAEGNTRGLVALSLLAGVALAGVHVTSPGNEGIFLAILALSGFAGRIWNQRDREGLAATAAAAELRSRHEATAERAVRSERLRLARELHDVTSHAVGTMMLQGGAALAVRDRDPDAARAALRTVQAAGSEAMGELQVLFGLLEVGTVGPAGLAPERAATDVTVALAALADRMRVGGLDVSVTTPRPLPGGPTLGATVYRIVQEALTNAARHAPGSRVRVVLASEGEWLDVSVSDDGPGAQRNAPEGGGFGLVGLAERVRMLGGELAAGPTPTGGFAVTARLPSREAEKAPT
jgi:signal transduction histidine kinase